MSRIDIAREILLDPDARSQQLTTIASIISKLKARFEDPRSHLDGVSVIVPSYLAADRIEGFLDSLSLQTLEPELFEVLIIINGPDDGTYLQTLKYLEQHDISNVRVFSIPVAGAGRARNFGLNLARYKYVTFVDDDDFIEPQYLESAYKVADESSIVLSPIKDLSPDGTLEENNVLNSRIATLEQPVAATSIPWAFGFNACKLVPTKLAQRFRYSEVLRNGEDLVYFANLLVEPGLMVKPTSTSSDSAYIRSLRDNSVSRQTEDYQFAVLDRLAAIKGLLEILEQDSLQQERSPIKALINAQAGFIGRYLEEFPDERQRVAKEIQRSGISEFPWGVLQAQETTNLAFMYCFSPYSDTSAIVGTRVLAEQNQLFDIFSNDMSGVRKYDPGLEMVTGPFVSYHEIIDANPSFGNWKSILRYATKAVARAELRQEIHQPYKTMYSRALWIGAHLAAALFKLRHWNVRWVAEFSDPLRRGVKGELRVGEFEDDEYSEKLISAIRARGFDDAPYESLFHLVELATVILADKLIFTTEMQRDYMASLYSDPKIRQVFIEKSTIRSHPVPSEELYELQQSTYPVPKRMVNIGYFGAFYPNRGMGELLEALVALEPEDRRYLRIHIFCNKPTELQRTVQEFGVVSNVYVNPYLPYLEFLNTLKNFDVLVVNDANTLEDLPINPFLPSKLSDYIGAGRDVWGIYEKGSTLAALDLQYKSESQNLQETIKVLKKLNARAAEKNRLRNAYGND
jgi:glycosyltransferase involved in cell wall biosynthesis